MSNNTIRIDYDYYLLPEFIAYAKSNRRLVNEFIIRSVIRESKEVKEFGHGGHYIYKQHFLKGTLVGRYPQSKIAEYLETSQPYVSAAVKKLVEENLIEIIKRPVSNEFGFGEINYYKAGYWTGAWGEETYKERLFFDIKFENLARARKERIEGDHSMERIRSLERLLEMVGPEGAHNKEEIERINEGINDLKKR